MSDFSNISSQLEAALVEVESSKKTLDEVSAKVQEASARYNDAVSNAKSLRNHLANELNKVIPDDSGRVRVSG